MWMAGAVIRRYRLEAGMDQSQLAELLQVSQAQMSRLEAGVVPLTPEQLLFLADHFCAPDILLEYIQPFLDRALDLSGAAVSPPEKYLLALLRETIDEIAVAVAADDRDTATQAAARLTAFAQVVRVVVSR